MATNDGPIHLPTTVEMLLKKRDPGGSDNCPDVIACPLQVIENPGEDQIMVEDGPRNSKLVKVGLLAQRGGCNFLVRVGMIESGGPIAVGDELITTEHHHVETFPDGSSIDTVTYTYHRQIWEKRLQGCLDRPDVFMIKNPVHLLNARYRKNGETVNLIVYQFVDLDAEETGWRVIVERLGIVAVEPLILEYMPSSDGLAVSAALSEDLLSVYIVESREIGATIAGTYHHYKFSHRSATWSQIATGLVPTPSSAVSARRYYVDRSGDVAGYWATESETRVESESDPQGASCENPDPLYTGAREGYARSSTYLDYSNYFGGSWNIVSKTYQQASWRSSGIALWDGELMPVIETVTSNSSQEISFYERTWEIQTTVLPYNFDRTQADRIDESLSYAAKIGDEDIGNTRDYGEYLLFSGENHYTVDYIGGVQPYYMTVDFLFDQYRRYESKTDINTTPGGWVGTHEYGAVNSADTAPYHDEFPANTNYAVPCPNLLAWLESERMTTENIDRKTVVYPHNLGEVAIIDKSFSSVDQVSGDAYVGALVRHDLEGDPVWYIFKNGKNVTTSIANCIARPLDQLAAIYWRA